MGLLMNDEVSLVSNVQHIFLINEKQSRTENIGVHSV